MTTPLGRFGFKPPPGKPVAKVLEGLLDQLKEAQRKRVCSIPVLREMVPLIVRLDVQRAVQEAIRAQEAAMEATERAAAGVAEVTTAGPSPQMRIDTRGYKK